MRISCLSSNVNNSLAVSSTTSIQILLKKVNGSELTNTCRKVPPQLLNYQKSKTLLMF